MGRPCCVTEVEAGRRCDEETQKALKRAVSPVSPVLAKLHVCISSGFTRCPWGLRKDAVDAAPANCLGVGTRGHHQRDVGLSHQAFHRLPGATRLGTNLRPHVQV